MKSRLPSKYSKVLIMTFLLCMTIYMMYLIQRRSFSEMQLKPCKLEQLDPWDLSIKPYITQSKPLVCSNRSPLMYTDYSGFIHKNESAIQQNGLLSIKISCVYRTVTRVDGDLEVNFGPEVKLETPFFVRSHVFRVTCLSGNGSLVYDYLHVNSFWNDTKKLESSIQDEDEDHPSVIMFGIDSVSRSHALRNLPLSFKYLLSELEAYDFEGYSKVGENTWPNLVPLFAGETHRDFYLVNRNVKHVDSMPLIWNEKEAEKFVTFFAEDRPDISTFNYMKAGFKRSPTDAYFRPYTLAMHKFEPVIIEPLGIASWNCFGSGSYFDLEVEYLKGFLLRYRQKRKLVYFWNNQVGHEDFTTLSRGELPLLNVLKWLKSENILKNSILAVFSDHGFRIGGASLTHTGRAENNRPLLLLHVPKSIKDKFLWMHKNLETNSKRLVAHYDTYQTVLEIIQDKAFRKKEPVSVKHGLVRRNIFNEVPFLRTCADAGIETKYCTCEEKVDVPIESDLVTRLAQKIVQGINTILSENQDVCESLRLHDVTEAKVSFSSSDETNTAPSKNDNADGFFSGWMKSFASENDRTGRYSILVHTDPGLAYFEGTVDYAEVSPRGIKDHVTLVGEPSRLDRYGNQSLCVKDSFLKLYCYCKDYHKNQR